MSTIENKRFAKFCSLINFTIPIDLQKTELINHTLSDDNSILDIDIKFNDEISPYSFFSFLLAIKRYRDTKIVPKFHFDILQYKKENVVKFIDFIVDNKTKYNTLKNINFKNELKVVEDYNYCINITESNESDLIVQSIANLESSLKKYGFNLLKLSVNVKKYSDKSIDDYLEADHIKQKEMQKYFDQLEAASINNKKNNNFAYGGFNSGTGKKRLRKIKNFISISLDELDEQEEFAAVILHGQIFATDNLTTKNQKEIYTFSISDYKGACDVKWILDKKLSDQQLKELSVNSWVKFFGSVRINTFNNSNEKNVLVDHYEIAEPIFGEIIDKNEEKRVELHTSSKNNTMDGLELVTDLLAHAEKLKMPAMAIMDENGAQSYPDAFNFAKKKDIKVLYGTAFSTIFKKNEAILGPVPSGNIRAAEYVAFDIETTGLSPKFDELIEFGAVNTNNIYEQPKNEFFIQSPKLISAFIEEKTGISNEMMKSGLDIKESLQRIYDTLNNKIAIAHNASFDYNFLKEKFRVNNMPFPNVTVIDTMMVSRMVFDETRHNLKALAKRVEIEYDDSAAHRAGYDAEVLALVWINLISILENNGIFDFKSLNEFCPERLYRRKFSNEITTIVKTQKGLKKQFQMISDCLTTNFNNGPKTYWEDIKKNDDILIGSSGLKGRLLEDYFFSSHEKFLQTLEYFDYVELPALSTLEHWIAYEKISRGDLEKGYKDIIKICKEKGIIPVATGEVKYNAKHEKIAYEVVVYAKGKKTVSDDYTQVGTEDKNNKNQTAQRHFLYEHSKAKNHTLIVPDMHFLSTDEMLEQFSFLGDQELINEIVIKNTQLIANMCEKIEIIKKDLYTPKFDNSPVKLKELVYKNARERYGEILPDIIEKRIDAELTPIIKYGFDVIYWISHKLVQASVDAGYIVGSRGSVGSSIVASLIGVSEVNPLPPHYLCNNCKYFEIVEDKNIQSGFDLVPQNCPKCSSKMDSDGQTIPFETFLGFNADKVPDIDLNFSGEFQSKIHDLTRELFGHSHTFRAGTISSVQSLTAFGYVKNYEEETGKTFSYAFKNFLAEKLVSLKRTTGQHPGGIIVIPKEFDVTDFTPINYPADDTNSSWLTTHFDYKKIHDNVLKLDILGHDNPSIIKKLEEYTGIKMKDVPKYDPDVISLFNNVEKLNIKPEDIGGEITGALGIPEFGTPFVRELLSQAKPKNFANLISISGLSHGTNVWLNNAQDLIMKKGFTLSNVVSCRDDILVFLLGYGVPPKFAFDIMEKVRKGKGIKPEEEVELRKYNVPDWQIDSMQKIAYMFPKAHATAYVLMAWVIAWFKLYKPLAFYATFFGIRSRAFDIETMVDKRYGIKADLKIKEIEAMDRKLRKVKDNDLVDTLELVREFYARGFVIKNISLEKSLDYDWIILEEEKALIPPFIVVDGLGGTVAESIVNERKIKMFSSLEDFTRRTTTNKTLIDKMDQLGVFKNVPRTDQISLFD
ncbi:PolC-type DNA polymerase III [Mycoplasmopsis opalescens]|uniref:PolC-type DNA polymerase III n=1 Tax=Mycoplasmopsis opalescens TaxID=114886 RepID=UPI0004A6DDC3|nr:PolC-type DNA polymerase III [Mycoplasmopsis opalescens]